MGDIEIPKAVARAQERATAHGWITEIAFAALPLQNVALRVRKPGLYAYAWWDLSNGCRFKGGATLGHRHFPTLRSFQAFLDGQPWIAP